MEGGASEPRLFSSLLCHCVKVIKKYICVFPGDKPKSRSPRLRPRSPAVLAGCARCAPLPPPRESRRSCSNYHPGSISDVFAFNAEYRLSRLTSSPPLTHAHTGLRAFSRPPLCSLGKGNWTERFTFRKAVSATSFCSPAPAGPGGAAGEVPGRREERL